MEFLKGLLTNVNHTSEGGELDKNDAFVICRGAIFAGIAGMCAYVASHLTGADFGPYTVVIVPAVMASLSAIQKWIASNDESKDK